jgi:hypothetical protein
MKSFSFSARQSKLFSEYMKKKKEGQKKAILITDYFDIKAAEWLPRRSPD